MVETLSNRSNYKDEPINLLFTINHDYLPQLMVCLSSIVRFPATYHVFILHAGLSQIDQKQIEDAFQNQVLLTFILLDPTAWTFFPTSRRYPLEIYFRLFAPYYLPQTVKKILYLDADIIVINPLNELYDMDIETFYFGGCTHVHRTLTKINQWRLQANAGFSYINSGVLLINVHKIRQERKKEDISDYVSAHSLTLWLPDQDVLSGLYSQQIMVLDYMRYNLSDRMLNWHQFFHPQQKKDIAWVRKNSTIIHYCGRNKPWQARYSGQLGLFYHELCASLQDEGQPLIPAG